MVNKILSLSIYILLFAGCGSGPLVEVTVVDERTALENQILGSYKEMDKEVLLLASVRAIDKKGKLIQAAKVPSGKRKVIHAIQRSSFNMDDIRRFKRLGVIGENNQAEISILNMGVVEKNEVVFLENLVKEENEDRLVVMNRVLEVNEDLSNKDFSSVRKVFSSLNRDKAEVGDMIQTEDGKWIKKEL
jgi:hypothetical protein